MRQQNLKKHSSPKSRHPTLTIRKCVECAYHICETDASPIYLRMLCEKTNTYIKTGIFPYQLNNVAIPEWCPKLHNNRKKKEK